MAYPTSAPWPARWPGYIPFPTPIPRSRGMVPNQQSVDWPQAQFAPLYLPPGSPSFQPYSYLKNDVPLSRVRPHYTYNNTSALTRGGRWRSDTGPGGDIAKLPFGGIMSNLAGLTFGSPSPGRRARIKARMAANAHARALAAQAAQDRSKGWGWRKKAQAVEAAGPFPAPSLFPAVVRMGARPTGQPIHSGIPSISDEFVPPEPIATAGLTNLYGGLALQNFGGLALANGDCIGCYGDAGWFTDEAGDTNWVNVGLAALIGWGALGFLGFVPGPISTVRDLTGF